MNFSFIVNLFQIINLNKKPKLKSWKIDSEKKLETWLTIKMKKQDELSTKLSLRTF